MRAGTRDPSCTSCGGAGRDRKGRRDPDGAKDASHARDAFWGSLREPDPTRPPFGSLSLGVVLVHRLARL